MSRPVWTPPQERIERTHMMSFMRQVREASADATDYAALHAWSVADPEGFWSAVWRYGEVRASQPWSSVLGAPDRMPGARWFAGARLNFAENLLRRRDDRPALIACAEDGSRRELSHAQLHAQVERLAAALHRDGVEPGDRVAGFVPNRPEAVIAMLAATRLGAVWSSCSPDFGEQGVLDRFAQINPKVLFSADGYFFKGRTFDSRARLARVAAQLPGLRRVVVFPYVQDSVDVAEVPGAVEWDTYMQTSQAGMPQPAQLPFDHPVYIMYSSGTTGKPKCIVHGAGGTLLQHLKEHLLHTDIGPGDRVFYFTTCGWMMWNWLVSALATGATLVLYDGSPFHPAPTALMDLAEREGITVFGTSASYIAALEKAGVRPRASHRLEPLRTILSTGSPLAPESFDYVYRDVKADVHLASISGGTDIISCFALGNPVLPVYRGQLQCRGLGMAVEVFDEAGRPVRERKGELVCTAPFPSMPVGFWNDPDGSRYRAAYFERYPGVWAHGDYAEITAQDGLIIHGRSDAVLNPGGVRIGTAEIYRQVDALAEVLESVAVGQSWRGSERVVLFVVLREGLTLDEDLRTRIRAVIRENTTPRHVPAKILQVGELPRTRSGKIVELAVRDVIHGRSVGNLEALANPDALEQFRDRPELASD
ncbi:acetoacetate--CoA ligase [Thioalkalivibrio denitrificans]|uniref:Acetoacetate--CoA ligase n=1 Tax=Thioalkalivibrio denitrificans TaxID=108003 RepID=A0A1V3NCD9_9GAMM|nr:acetoacetate--CoA ligase [Thioalkalivibrio denitrificans]OOG22767.1 acetoacetate--CoA ligase [Thioalkalivibrio denitrificans]